MQPDHLDILEALTIVLKAAKETDTLSTIDLQSWPTYASVLEKCKDEGSKTVYQCQELQKKILQQKCTMKVTARSTVLTSLTASRLGSLGLTYNSSKTSSFLLATQGWQKIIDENQPLIAINRIVKHFSVPLVSAGVDVDEFLCEFQGIPQYSTMCISLSTSDYHAVWWRLFHAPCASEWTNVLAHWQNYYFTSCIKQQSGKSVFPAKDNQV